MQRRMFQFSVGTMLLAVLGFAVAANQLLVRTDTVKPRIKVTKFQGWSGHRVLAISVVFSDSTSEMYASRCAPPDYLNGESLDDLTVWHGTVGYRFATPEFESVIDGVRSKKLTPRMIETYAKLRRIVADHTDVDLIPWSACAAKFDGTTIVNHPCERHIALTKDFERGVPKGELEGL